MSAAQYPNLRPNPGGVAIPGSGRPPGVRNRLTNQLITDLSNIWHEHGPQVLLKMALRDPVALARMAYATLKVPGGLSAEDWALLQQVLDLIRSAIPPGVNAAPAEVFGVIETALRSHYATRIPSD